MQALEEEISKKIVPENAYFQRYSLSTAETRIGTVQLRKRLYLYHETPVTSGPVLIGHTGVTTATGFKIPPNVVVPFPFSSDVVVFGISMTATDLSVIEQN